MDRAERAPGGRPRVHDMPPLAELVRKLAARRGLHLDELAERAGIGIATLYRLQDPRISTLTAIADVLDVPVSRLITPTRSSRRSIA